MTQKTTRGTGGNRSSSPAASSTKTAKKKAPASKTTAAKRVSAPKTTAKKKKAAPPTVDREAMIARAAFFRAEARGFVPGGEVEDWLQAEREVDATLSAS